MASHTTTKLSKTCINKKGRFSIVIPVFNHPDKIKDVVLSCLKLGFPIFVVDDGSTDNTVDQIKSIKGIHLIRHAANQGKGAAIMTGFSEAMKISDWAITIDADGQHNSEDAMQMISAIPENVRPIVVGFRKGMSGEHVHWTSSFGRKFSNFWVRLSGGPKASDTQSGFRIYPIPESIELNTKAKRFQFEVEILVKATWKGMTVIESPVSVSYSPGSGRVSHFKPFVDFVRNSQTFCRLIVQRLFLPISIRKRL